MSLPPTNRPGRIYIRMGNIPGRARGQQGEEGGEGEDNYGRARKTPWTGPEELDVTWQNFQERRASPYAHPEEDKDPLNGLIFPGGLVIPDDVLEVILTHLRVTDIQSCNLVCRNWKDVLIRRSFWKKWFEMRGKGVWWDRIPEHVKDKPYSWVIFYAQGKNEVFTKNFIRNHSGVGDGPQTYESWTIHKNGGDGWVLENPPQGCNPLPPDPFFQDSNSAWVTSFGDCSKWTQLDLWEIGLTPAVLTSCLPFNLVCTQMYTARFDCGGIFTWILRTLDEGGEIIQDFTDTYSLRPEFEWHKAEYAFHFRTEHKDKIGGLRYLVFVHEGRDNQFWKGHYGIKFSRSCVKFEFENLPERR